MNDVVEIAIRYGHVFGDGVFEARSDFYEMEESLVVISF